MESWAKKKARIIPEYQGEDRISGLPDELIHKIYSFLDTKEALQASVLSKRWKFIWTTLPFISFSGYDYSIPRDNLSWYTMLIRHVLCNRNHQSHISELKLYVPRKLTVKQSVSKKKFRGCVIEKFIEYAMLHNVKCLNIGLDYAHQPYKLSTFSSKSLEKLTLQMQLEKCRVESDCWDLPALTTLHLKYHYFYILYGNVNSKLSASWLTSLPALRTLQIDLWNLSETSFCLPNLTTLRLCTCLLRQTVWDLPALLTLHLDIGDFPENMSDMFPSLSSLNNLTLILHNMQQDHFISCPQLVNLNIRTDCDKI